MSSSNQVSFGTKMKNYFTAKRIKTAGSKVFATVIFPLLMYAIMAIVCAANGITYNLFSSTSIADIVADTGYMAVVALGIAFQLKYGRYDFTGGAILVVAATVGAMIVFRLNLNMWVLILICIVVGIALSVLNSVVYVFARVPILVCSLAMGYVIEAIGAFISGGESFNITGFQEMNQFGYFPWILLPLALALLLNHLYSHFTIAGRQSRLLQQNQLAAVNIGINERKNVIICYVASGAMFGLAGAIYASQNQIIPNSEPLATVTTLFANIVPSLVGLFLSRFIDDGLGTLIGALTISILYYGLALLGHPNDGLRVICFATFLLIFIFFSGFYDEICKMIKYLIYKIKKKKKQSNLPATET